MERAGGFAAALGVAAGDLWLCAAADAQDGCEALRVCGHDSGFDPGIFPGDIVLCRAAVLRAAGRNSGGRQRFESAAAIPGDGDSSADALPGLRGVLSSLLLCAGRADDALSRRKVDQDYPRVDHGDLA